jgi:hypothetical protein
VDKGINSFFDWIGHLKTPRSFFERVFGKGSFGASVAIGISDFVTAKVNALLDTARELVLDGVRLPLKLMANAVAGIAATVNVVGRVANILVRWTGKLYPAPNPTAKGVGDVGVPGRFLLHVEPDVDVTWPTAIVDCAKTLANFQLPNMTPTGAQVSWDVTEQHPRGLIDRLGDSGPLNDTGDSQLNFVTTTETPEQAKGKPALGIVVAVATIHRTDLDRLVELVTDTLFAALPDVVKNEFGPQLRKLAAPIIDKATAQFRKLRDIQATGRLVVRYHVPKPEKKKRKLGPTSGTWQGAFQSRVYPDLSGRFVMNLVQTGTGLSGTIDIAGSDCVSRGTVSGQVQNGQIHIGAVQAEHAIRFDGRIRGSRMSGTYAAPACGDDSGSWAAQTR